MTDPHPRRWAGLAVLSASLLVVVMDMTILNVALPELARDLRPSALETLWIVDVYTLVVAGLLVAASALGDRFGRRRILVAGYVVFALASASVLLAESSASLIAMRVALGVGGAMIMPSTLAMIRVTFTDPRERGTALGVWAAVAGVGGVLGPLVGGTMLEVFSWRAAFLINVPLMVLAAVAAFRLLPESRAAKAVRLDLAGLALSILGMAALVYAIKALAKDGLEPGTALPLLVAAVVLFAFIRRCLVRPEPVLDLRLLRLPGFAAGTVTALTTILVFSGVLLLGAQWLQYVEGLSPLAAGVALIPVSATGIGASLLAPAFAARVGPRNCLVGGLVLAAVGMLTLFAGLATFGYPALAAALALLGLGTGALAVGSNLIMTEAPPQRVGSAAAIEETSYELGSTVGVALLGSAAVAAYRLELPASAEPAARESIVAALDQAVSGAGLELAAVHGAYTDGFAIAGLLGGVILLVSAAVVWLVAAR